MDKLMDSPWFLRLTALSLAIILFFFVKAGQEKSAGQAIGDAADIIRDVPVEVIYDSENLVVTGAPEAVDMTIEGPANLVQTAKLLRDFTLRLDLARLPMGEHTVKITTENISDKLNVRIEPSEVTVNIEEKITQSFRVDAELNERLLAEDYFIEKIEADPSVIEVTGAKSVIDAISFVKATVTSDKDISKSFEQKARVRILDKDLNKLNVTIAPEEVNVKVKVAQYDKEVPIVIESLGTPEEGLTIRSLSANKQSITLSGSRKALEDIDSFIVNVDVSKVKKSEVLDVNLKKPKGISTMSLDKLQVRVEAVSSEGGPADEQEALPSDPPEAEVDTQPAEQTAAKEFTEMPIAVKGLDTSYSSSFIQPANGAASLRVTGGQQLIDRMKASDFKLYIDASEVKEVGEFTFPLSVEGPENVQWKLSDEKVTITIELA